MNILFLSCQKATELIEKKNYMPLSNLEGLQLKMHKAMCNPCKEYQKQSDILEKCLEENHNSVQVNPGEVDSLKNSITDKLANING